MKRVMPILVWIFMLMVLAGCSETGSPGVATTNSMSSAEKVEQQGGQAEDGDYDEEQTNDKKTKSFLLETYYSNNNLTDLVAIEKTIQWAAPNTKYEIAFNELTLSPGTDSIPLWEQSYLRNIDFTNGQLQIDLSKDELPSTGSSAERLMILSILKTMFEFPEVKEIALTIDGELTETLSGHMQINQPFTREMLTDL
jgi:spore germination protein GerM